MSWEDEVARAENRIRTRPEKQGEGLPEWHSPLIHALLEHAVKPVPLFAEADAVAKGGFWSRPAATPKERVIALGWVIFFKRGAADIQAEVYSGPGGIPVVNCPSLVVTERSVLRLRPFLQQWHDRKRDPQAQRKIVTSGGWLVYPESPYPSPGTDTLSDRTSAAHVIATLRVQGSLLRALNGAVAP